MTAQHAESLYNHNPGIAESKRIFVFETSASEHKKLLGLAIAKFLL
ncbi:MAG: hypothetical protein HC879_19430 [Leptolyngbyaceae cyanobacterium SL_5_9]|nr:hypothetical protein [Leptolyngbyaceae cyanobacterium SL_5_9]NJO74637.1 hypothetical protein [Leptolyngbyaceae cyanobacterium RM1_406_9]